MIDPLDLGSLFGGVVLHLGKSESDDSIELLEVMMAGGK